LKNNKDLETIVKEKGMLEATIAKLRVRVKI
jgi:hypothetical protein